MLWFAEGAKANHLSLSELQHPACGRFALDTAAFSAEPRARRILERLARNGPPTAQVAGIKVLIELDKATEAEAEAESAFERLGLYEDEFLYETPAEGRLGTIFSAG